MWEAKPSNEVSVSGSQASRARRNSSCLIASHLIEAVSAIQDLFVHRIGEKLTIREHGNRGGVESLELGWQWAFRKVFLPRVHHVAHKTLTRPDPRVLPVSATDHNVLVALHLDHASKDSS